MAFTNLYFSSKYYIWSNSSLRKTTFQKQIKFWKNFKITIHYSNKIPKVLDWISTHPDSKDRAAEILKKEKTMSCKIKIMMSNEQWTTLQDRIKSTSEIIQEATED